MSSVSGGRPGPAASVHPLAGILDGVRVLSLFASALMLQQVSVSGYLTSGELLNHTGSGAPFATTNEAYATADGHVMIAAYQPARRRRFCQAIGSPGLADDPRDRTLPERMARSAELTRELESILVGRTTVTWRDLLDAADIICAPVADYARLMVSPQLDAGGLRIRTSHPNAVMAGFAIGGTPFPVHRPPPPPGEHDALLEPFLERLLPGMADA
ncbi:MAG: L-carnitine dehydratase/bile acid-inducible protein [Bradyrhizobium sp.]|nr:L-carnitine dehydratase/bile acid-inducible protein [Bradyrhizobium sp.]